MIKSAQIEDLTRLGFHYITCITREQIKTLIQQKFFQLSFFDETIMEVEQEGVRYVLRRNLLMVQEMAKTRQSKKQSIQKLVEEKNLYLKEHLKAKIKTALTQVHGSGKVKVY